MHVQIANQDDFWDPSGWKFHENVYQPEIKRYVTYIEEAFCGSRYKVSSTQTCAAIL